MEDKKSFKVDGGIEISEEALQKIRKDAVNDFKKEMIRTTIKKEFECFGCKNLPRPSQTTIKKCKTCSKIFCGICGLGSHLCSDGTHTTLFNEYVPLKIDVEFLPYFCKNNKFGCEEILFKDSELFEHEPTCAFQIICCPGFSCKNKVNFLNYLDHFKEKHDDYEDLGEGRTFKLPLPMDQIQSQVLKVTLKNDVLAFKSSLEGKYQKSDQLFNGKPTWLMNSYAYASKAIWYQDKDKFWNIGLKADIGKNRSMIYCTSTTSKEPDDSNNVWKYMNLKGEWVVDNENDVSVQSIFDKAIETSAKWSPKKFTAFGKTFFDVSIIRNKIIYKWIYVLALPDEAKKFQVDVSVKNSMGEIVLDYHEQTRSMVESHDFVIENEKCFMLGIKKAKGYAMKDTNQVDYTVKIRNLKDEAKDEDEESGIDD